MDFLPVTSLADVVSALTDATQAGQAADERTTQQYLDSLLARCERLATRVIAWNWTDLMGKPLPQPYGRPDVLLALSNDELRWLLQPSEGLETGGESKNG